METEPTFTIRNDRGEPWTITRMQATVLVVQLQRWLGTDDFPPKHHPFIAELAARGVDSRGVWALRMLRATSAERLACVSRAQLMDLRNVGKRTIERIERAAAEIGVTMKWKAACPAPDAGKGER